MTTRAEIIAEAREWIGTRYAHGQSVKGVGADCIGFAGGVPRELGMPSAIAWSRDQSCKGYGPDPNQRMLEVAIVKYLDPISISAAGIADLLLMRFEREPHHFALISRLNPMYVIHAYASSPHEVCETPVSGYWRQRTKWRDLIVSAWRFREVTD